MPWKPSDIIALVSVISSGMLGVGAIIWNIISSRIQAKEQFLLKEQEILLAQKLQVYADFLAIEWAVPITPEHRQRQYAATQRLLLLATPEMDGAVGAFFRALGELHSSTPDQLANVWRERFDPAHHLLLLHMRKDIRTLTATLHLNLKRRHPDLFDPVVDPNDLLEEFRRDQFGTEAPH